MVMLRMKIEAEDVEPDGKTDAPEKEDVRIMQPDQGSSVSPDNLLREVQSEAILKSKRKKKMMMMMSLFGNDHGKTSPQSRHPRRSRTEQSS